MKLHLLNKGVDQKWYPLGLLTIREGVGLLPGHGAECHT